MTTTPTDLLVTDVLKAEIAKAKAKHDRMPKHWVDRREAEMARIMKLVDQLNALTVGR